MNPDRAFWAAVRIAGLGRLAITEDNFHTLWPDDLPERDWWAPEAVPHLRDWWRIAGFPTTAGLWRDYVEFVKDCLSKKTRTTRPAQLAVTMAKEFQREGGWGVIAPWPRRGGGRPLCADLQAVQARTRKTLYRICAAENVRPFVEGLCERHPPIQGRILPAGRGPATWRAVKIRFHREPRAGKVTLQRHLDDLWVAILRGSHRPAFFRCSGCQRFAVARQKLRRNNFCSDRCRDEFHHPRKQPPG